MEPPTQAIGQRTLDVLATTVRMDLGKHNALYQPRGEVAILISIQPLPFNIDLMLQKSIREVSFSRMRWSDDTKLLEFQAIVRHNMNPNKK